MNAHERKFRLFARLQELGFTYTESAQLRRIEMTLKRWAERECGDGSNWAIERDEVTGKPFNVYHGEGKPHRYSIADKETGALRRLKAIVDARNQRKFAGLTDSDCHADFIHPYHQGDPRGAMLYLVRTGDLAGQSIDSIYTRGLAVCA